jgi:putative oxidoreductase
VSAGEPRLIVPAVAPLYRALAGCGDVLLRVMCGAILLPPGWHKVTGPLFERDVALFHQLGLEPAVPLMWFITALELAGGAFLIIGFLTRPIAIMITVEMLVIAFAVDIPSGRGYSFTLLWAAVAFSIFIRGGGKLSLDRWIGREF